MEDKFVKRKGLFVPESYGKEFPNVFLYKELHENQIQFWISIPFKQGMISYVMVHDLDGNGVGIEESCRYNVVYDDYEKNTTKIFDSVLNREEPLSDVEEPEGQA